MFKIKTVMKKGFSEYDVPYLIPKECHRFNLCEAKNIVDFLSNKNEVLYCILTEDNDVPECKQKTCECE